GEDIHEVLDALILERVFEGREDEFAVWKAAEPAARRLLWVAQTQRVKLSAFAEEFFRRLAGRLGHAILLRKGELYRLVDFLPADEIAEEVRVKLDLLRDLFAAARPEEET
ncbi:MAG: AAA family ATPase, partial [Acidobacteriota bacterium]|nr:AAA family ATPase [Acidobacteriota bacterium]